MRDRFVAATLLVAFSTTAFAADNSLKDAAYLLLGKFSENGKIKSNLYYINTDSKSFLNSMEQGKKLLNQMKDHKMTMNNLKSQISESSSCIYTINTEMSALDGKKTAFTSTMIFTVDFRQPSTYEITKSESGEVIGMLTGGENFSQLEGTAFVPIANTTTKKSETAMNFPTMKIDTIKWLAAAKRLSDTHCAALTAK